MTKYHIVEIPLRSINSSKSYIDVSLDYYELSYFAETLGKYSEQITYKRLYDTHPVTYQFECLSKNDIDFERLKTALYNYLESGEVTDDLIFDPHGYNPEKLEKLLFPELLDNFHANFLPSLYEEQDEYLYNQLLHHPEYKYYFWKSALSKNIKSDVYCSHKMWLIPNDIETATITDHIGFKYLNFEKAHLLVCNNEGLLINSNNAIKWPEEELQNAKQLVSHLMDKNSRDNKDYDFTFDTPMFTEYYLDTEANLILVVDNYGYSYLLDYPEKYRNEDLRLFNELLNSAFSPFDKLMGYSHIINCDWSNIDDETFEQLCYDVIYYSERYDNSSIKKMGNSRSRDGGRDIEVWTKDRLGSPPVKFIFQSKQTQAKSLSARKVQDIGDTIDQYGAKGYGIMTSTVIDSTLYDKLEGIKRNRNIETVTWSVYEIERFLERHPEIKQRYF